MSSQSQAYSGTVHKFVISTRNSFEILTELGNYLIIICFVDLVENIMWIYDYFIFPINSFIFKILSFPKIIIEEKKFLTISPLEIVTLS